MKWFQGSPLMRVYLRALGAKIGDDVIIGDLDVGALDLVTIGDGASIGGKIKLANAHVDRQRADHRPDQHRRRRLHRHLLRDRERLRDRRGRRDRAT